MSIWLWIGLSVLLSMLFVGKKKIDIAHYIWLLLPVDMYGLSLMGATIKPYMLFSVLLMINVLYSGRGKITANRNLITGGVICILIICINFINNQSLSSVKAALMLLIVWGCSVVYINSYQKESIKQIPTVLRATSLGYGIVFILAYLTSIIGVKLPGAYTMDRMSAGIVMEFHNMHNGMYIRTFRLRGFTMDPNTIVSLFSLGSTVGIINIASGNKSYRDYLCIAVSAICVFLSNSRMGIISFCGTIVIAVTLAYRISKQDQKRRMIVFALLSAFLLATIALSTDMLQMIYQKIMGLYSNRSGLNDEHGRFTIWSQAIEVLFDRNPLFGVGFVQMRNLSPLRADCHNTWLEAFCANGLFVGGAFVLYFMSNMLQGYQILRANLRKREYLFAIAEIGLVITIISLISVDNLTYSYLWYLTALLSTGREMAMI